MATDSALTPATTTDAYLRNMTKLWASDPRLAVIVDAIDDNDLPPLETTRSGDWTIKRTTTAGRDIYLHSRYDPLAEARKWAGSHPQDDKFCYVVEGCGLGYPLAALAEVLPSNALIIVLEPDLELLRWALTCVDVSERIADGSLVFLTDARKEVIHDKLSERSAAILMGTHIVSHKPSVQLNDSFYTTLRAVLTEFIEYSKTAMVTLMINSQITCRNVSRNLATYLAAPSIVPLKSTFSGYPAIVVSAGPSLRKNGHLLRDLQDHAVIIATQTTYKPLLARGVTPHFVCSLDYHEISGRYFQGAEEHHPRTHLVAEPKAHPAVIDAYHGPVSLLHNSFAELCLGRPHKPQDGLRAGASVAHLAFYLAEFLGCDPIILTGQDLALTGNVYYAPGTALHSAWQAETNRFCTMEMKEWEYIVRFRPILRRVRGHDGSELYTEELMLNYLEQFERDFSRTTARVINATEGGAAIRGTEPLPLADVASTLCTRRLPSALFDYRRRTPWLDPTPLDAGRRKIDERVREVGAIVDLCNETLAVLTELHELVDTPTAFNRKIKRVDQLRVKIRDNVEAYTIITTGAQLAEFRKFSADQRLQASGAQGSERARQQLARDSEFVRTLRDDAERMLEIMKQCSTRFDETLGQLDA